MNYTDSLQWRYAAKKFNGEKISQEIVERITDAIRLSASSLGLQSYRLVVVENQELKEQLSPAFFHQLQITTCSHLVLFVCQKHLDEKYVNDYFDNIQNTRQTPMENLSGFRTTVDGYLKSKSVEQTQEWNSKQSYIGLGTGLMACALEKVDACPMEGFQASEVEKILGLDTDKELVSLAMPIGYRDESDFLQHLKKVRKPKNQFIDLK